MQVAAVHGFSAADMTLQDEPSAKTRGATMIAVSGASGKLGSRVLAGLLKVLASDQLLALVCSPEQAARWVSRGVRVRRADPAVPETLAPALAGVKRLLLVSGDEPGEGVDQDRAMIAAAKAAGVEQVAYTSVLRADTSVLPIAHEHRSTEEMLRGCGLPWVILRTGWSIDNYIDKLPMALSNGAFFGAARNGWVAAATRADYAAAAVTVLTTDGHCGKTYELAGDRALTMELLAEAGSRWAGEWLPYTDFPASEFRLVLARAGLPEKAAEFAVATDLAIARGALNSSSRDLHTLIGRRTTMLHDVLAILPRPPRAGAQAQSPVEHLLSGHQMGTARHAPQAISVQECNGRSEPLSCPILRSWFCAGEKLHHHASAGPGAKATAARVDHTIH